MARFSEVIPAAGRYVNAADKAMLADLAVPLRIIRSVYQPRAGFGPRWLVDVAALNGGECIAIDFAAAAKDGTPIEARTVVFGAIRDRIDAGETFDPVVLEQVTPAKGGNAFWTFRDATPAEIADPAAPDFADDDADEKPADLAPVGRQKLAKAGR